MIERLYGRCVLKQTGAIVLDVGGVGYGLEMTEPALARIGEDSETPLTLWVHTHVREDAIRLFGFLTQAERLLFAQLLAISGVGPKVAIAILGVVPLQQLINAIEQDDSVILEEVPGIGPRQSKKILLELKPKLGKLASLGLLAARTAASAGAAALHPAAANRSLFDDKRRGLSPVIVNDLRSALENFGYKEKELTLLLRRFERDPPARELPSLIRLALAELAGGPAAGPGPSGRQEELF